jgi:ubiquinone/menaquinone biosynthesis C-methylase UbiE
MNHEDHVNLLLKGIPDSGGVWADFGSGRGAFTLALAELIGPSGEIYSVDKNRRALSDQERAMQARFPERDADGTHYIVADFTEPIHLPPLDGVVMANALHFAPEKDRVLELMCRYLKPGGRFILVEYNIARGNPWVPHPISYPQWEQLASRHGFAHTLILATRSSRTFSEIYSALTIKSITSTGASQSN